MSEDLKQKETTDRAGHRTSPLSQGSFEPLLLHRAKPNSHKMEETSVQIFLEDEITALAVVHGCKVRLSTVQREDETRNRLS